MPGKNRFQTEQAASVISTFEQKNFSGGLVTDRPASELTDSELSKADNVVCFPHDVIGRSGSPEFSSVVLPGSGTVHALKNHTIGNKWLLHRDDKLWRSDREMTAWEELTLTGTAGNSFGEDFNSQVIQNKEDFVIGTTSGIFIIKFAEAGTDIVYPANGPSPDFPLVGRGTTNTTQAHVYRIVYTYVRLTGTTTDGRITPGAVLEQETGSVNITNIDNKDYGIIYTDSPINQSDPLLYFFSMRFSANTSLDKITLSPPGLAQAYNTGDAFEMFTDGTLPSPFLTNTTYYAISLAAPTEMQVATTRQNAYNGIVIDILDTGTGSHYVAPDIKNNAGDHHTHIGIYMTADLGEGIINPQTNTGFNEETYVWIQDTPLSSVGTDSITSITINTDQDTWLARLASGDFILRTRQFAAIPNGDVIAMTGGWFFATSRTLPTVYYSQITDKNANGVSLGYHNIGFQSHKLDDGIQVFVEATDYLVIGTFSKTYMFRLTSSRNVGFLEAVLQLTPPMKVDDTIGITQWTTVSQISESRFIAVCSDSSVRIFDTVKWSRDLSLDRVKNTEIKQMEAEAVAGYFQGAYYIWYAKDTTDTFNVNTLRLAVENEAGEGWTTYSGDDWIKPPFLIPPISLVNDSSVQIFTLLDLTASKVYQIETFLGSEGSGLAKTYLDQGVTAVNSSIKSKEITGGRESNRKIVQEAHAYIRTQVESDGLPIGFEVTAKDYVDGSITATETVTNVPFTGDIEFFKQAEGARLQAEFITNSSDFRLVGIDVDFIESKRKKIAPTITQTDEYQAMDSLASQPSSLVSGNNLSAWITKPDYFLNRADNTRPDDWKTIKNSDLAFVFVDGPGGKECTAIEQYNDDGEPPFVEYDTITYPYSINESSFDFHRDLTISFWIRNTPTGVKIIQSTGSYYIQFDDLSTLNFSGLFTVTIDTLVNDTWYYFTIIRSAGDRFKVYQDLVEKFNADVTAEFIGTDLVLTFVDSGATTFNFIDFYDVRIWQTIIINGTFFDLDFTIEDFTHYFNDVLTNEGSLYLPYG